MSTTKKGAKSAKVEKAINAVKAGQVVRTAELQTARELAAQVIEDAKKAMTAKQQAAQERRNWLRAISADFQAQRELMEMTGAEYIPTINEMLHAYYAKQNNITELNTFDQWKEKGYQVRRGEKAFLFWGKPKSRQQQPTEPTGQDEQGEQAQQVEPLTAKQNDYYPLCYLFDISQCHKAQA
ncbi:MAG: hypothetical protein E7074_06610 [Bacteroidales bacterium]|nr:hypothetical protein [Bacteroidales bacterium]